MRDYDCVLSVERALLPGWNRAIAHWFKAHGLHRIETLPASLLLGFLSRTNSGRDLSFAKIRRKVFPSVSGSVPRYLIWFITYIEAVESLTMSSCPALDCANALQVPPPLQPNPDISGIGVRTQCGLFIWCTHPRRSSLDSLLLRIWPGFCSL